MRRVSVLQWAWLWALVAFAPTLWSADCSAPITLPDEPELSEFSDYNTFLVEVMEYKTSKRKRVQHRKACPQVYRERQRPNRNPTVIEEPETLSEALQRADKIPRLDYSQHQTWYNRTTSRSFPLPDLGRDRLEDKWLQSNLRMMREAAEPRSGAGVLAGIFSSRLNEELFSGEQSQDRDGLLFEQLLPEQQNRAEEASSSFGFGAGIAFISQVQDTEQGSLRLFIGGDGNPLKSVGTVQVEDCLSSCVTD
jgi:hypothetical protein